MRQLLNKLTPKGTTAPPSIFESTPVTIIETGSGSAPAAATTIAMNNFEELTLQMIEQFFATMTY